MSRREARASRTGLGRELRPGMAVHSHWPQTCAGRDQCDPGGSVAPHLGTVAAARQSTGQGLAGLGLLPAPFSPQLSLARHKALPLRTSPNKHSHLSALLLAGLHRTS